MDTDFSEGEEEDGKSSMAGKDTMVSHHGAGVDGRSASVRSIASKISARRGATRVAGIR